MPNPSIEINGRSVGPGYPTYIVAELSANHNQDYEQAVELVKRALDTAVGVQLDVIGRIVGQDRGTFDEDTYRTFLQGRILVNRSSGTVDQMIELVNTLLPDGASMVVREYYPAAFEIEVIGAVPDWFGNALAAITLEAKGVGITPHVRWFNGVEPFRFAAVAGLSGDEFRRAFSANNTRGFQLFIGQYTA